MRQVELDDEGGGGRGHSELLPQVLHPKYSSEGGERDCANFNTNSNHSRGDSVKTQVVIQFGTSGGKFKFKGLTSDRKCILNCSLVMLTWKRTTQRSHRTRRRPREPGSRQRRQRRRRRRLCLFGKRIHQKTFIK